MSEKEKWAEYERITGIGLPNRISYAQRASILALAAKAEAGERLRQSCTLFSVHSNDLSDVQVDGSRHFQNYQSEYRVSGKAIETYDARIAEVKRDD